MIKREDLGVKSIPHEQETSKHLEILFRIYNSTRKSYLRGDDIDRQIEKGIGAGRTGHIENIAYYREPNFCIERSTSLPDKNGDPIFEGDRVKLWLRGNTRKEKICSVVYLRHKAMFILIDELGDGYTFDEYAEIEIIGNIHTGIY